MRGGERQPVPSTHLHEVDSAGLYQRLGEFVRTLHQPQQVVLSFEGQTTAVTASLGPASPTHIITSSKHGQQVFSDRINVAVTINGMKNSELTVPCRQGSGLLMVGAQSVVDGRFVVVGTALGLKGAARATPFRNRIERIVVHRTTIGATEPTANAFHDAFVGNFNGKDVGDGGDLRQSFSLWNGRGNPSNITPF